MAQLDNDSLALSQNLLLGVSEEVKLPLLQIARLAEQGQLSGEANLAQIRTSAQTALQLLDNYSLGVRLTNDSSQLDIEAISVSSVLYDTSQQLDALAKSYGVKLELNIAGRYGPVMANRQGLQAALTSLGAALIEALPALEAPSLNCNWLHTAAVTASWLVCIPIPSNLPMKPYKKVASYMVEVASR